MKTVSFDFDETLSKESVQLYAKELINRGVDVWIVTSRYEDITRYSDYDIKDPSHDDLFSVANDLGIRDKIIFTNFTDKWIYFYQHPEFIWHLDDMSRECNLIASKTKVRGLSLNGNWKGKCNKFLKVD